MFGTDGGGWGLGMGPGMWIFWVVLIVIIVVLARGFGSGSASSTPDKSPMDILKTRFAQGEIDEEEFNRRRRELEK